MDWSMIGAIGEIGGAIAVVASLLYVGRQLKQAASVAAVEGFDFYNGKVVEFSIAVAQDERLAELMIQVQTEGLRREQLTGSDRGRVGYAYFAGVVLTASLFHRWRHGLLTEHEFEENATRATGLMAAPYFADVWPIMADAFGADYRAWVEQRFEVRSQPLPGGTA